MDLTLRTVEPDTEDQRYISWLYDLSFPPAEQEKMENIMKVSRTDFGHLYAILDGDTRVGMLYILTRRDLVYVYYLAVDPQMRQKGYGSEILSLIKREHPGCRLVLNSEAPDEKAPNNAERLARISFYQKNGFSDTGRRTSWNGITFAHLLCGGRVGRFEVGRMFAIHRKLSRRADSVGSDRFCRAR